MPLILIRNHIMKMQIDAVVNDEKNTARRGRD